MTLSHTGGTLSSQINDGAALAHNAAKEKRLKSINKWLPNAFPNAQGVIPNNPVIAAILAALLKAGPKAKSMVGGWSQMEDGRLCYRHTRSIQRWCL